MAQDVQVQFGANVSQALGQINALAAQIDSLENPVKRISVSFGQMENAAGKASRQTDNLSKVMGTLKTAIAGIAVYKLGEQFLGASMGMQALDNKMRAAVGSGDAARDSMAFVREEADRLGLRFKVAADGFAGFSASALRAGIPMQQTKQIFSDISTAAVSMNLSNEKTQAVFKALEQMAGKGTVSIEELRQQLGDHLPGAFEIAAASMGKSTSEFAKMVEEGKVYSDEFLPKFAEAAKTELGGSVAEASQSARANLNRLQTAFDDLYARMADNGGMQGTNEGLRILTDLVVSLTPLVSTLAGGAILWLARSMAGLYILLMDVGSSAQKLVDWLKALGAAGVDLLSILNAMRNFDPQGAIAAFDRMKENWRKNMDEMAVNARIRASAIQSEINRIHNALEKKPDVPALGSGGAAGEGAMAGKKGPENKREDKAAKSRVSEWEAELAKRMYDEQVYFDKAKQMELKYWQDKMANTQLSAAERASIEKKLYSMQQGVYQDDINKYVASLEAKQAAAKRDFAEVMRLQGEKMEYIKKWYGEDSAEYQKVLKQKADMEMQHQQDIERRYKQVFTSISNAFSGAVKGMVVGGQTFQQSLLGILDGLFNAFVDYIAKMVVEWAVSETMKTGATATGAAARTGIEASATATQGAMQTAYQSKSIMGSAATTYAGVFANMSPTLGPFAAIPAGIAAAAVGAQTALLPSFAVGAWELPGDTVAQLHKGEMVVPRTFAESLRENGSLGNGMGGGSMQVQINAMDARSVQRVFRQNGGAMAATMRNEARNFNRNTRMRGGSWKG